MTPEDVQRDANKAIDDVKALFTDDMMSKETVACLILIHYDKIRKIVDSIPR